jgi:hypothetical protein
MGKAEEREREKEEVQEDVLSNKQNHMDWRDY